MQVCWDVTIDRFGENFKSQGDPELSCVLPAERARAAVPGPRNKRAEMKRGSLRAQGQSRSTRTKSTRQILTGVGAAFADWRSVFADFSVQGDGP